MGGPRLYSPAWRYSPRTPFFAFNGKILKREPPISVRFSQKISQREEIVEEIVKQNLVHWQHQGLIPLMAIATGEETEGPIRTMGWTHWHHLFSARQLLTLAITRKHIVSIQDPTVRASLDIAFASRIGFRIQIEFLGKWACKGLPGKGFLEPGFKTWFTYRCACIKILAELIYI